MSEPLSKVFQFKRKPSPTYFPANEGYNLCLDELDQLSPDVNKLAKMITEVKQHELYDLNLSSQYLAKQIINQMGKWITKGGHDV